MVLDQPVTRHVVQVIDMKGPSVARFAALMGVFSTTIETFTEVDDVAAPLVSRLVSHVPQFAALDLHTFWLPFLRALIPVLISNHIPLDPPRYQELVSAVLKAYLDIFIGREPSMERALAMHCSYSDCNTLSAFLSNPMKRVGYCAVDKGRRMHPHPQLDAASIDCLHETRRSGSPLTLV